ncbi:MAG TPA: MerR family transcriptional regulator [Solirubrobacteraceae bacterium]|nr:MerR family transcriptional regulator [Solirubrobacteraceae bacterium]
MSGAADETFTIDELARRTGMTVRNIRAHQSRGLLPPPELRGRTGYYGPAHVARIEQIRDLQTEGFNLEGIRKLLETAGGEGDEVLRFTRAVREPFEEPGREVPLAELVERWGGDPKVLERAVSLGLLRPLGEGWFEEVSPSLGRASEEIADLGVPADAALDVVARLRKQADGAARAFIDLYLDQVWKPFEAAGRPPERWPEVREALERLRPFATDVMMAIFRMVMTERVEEAFGRELERAAKRTPDKPPSRGKRGRHEATRE